MVFLNAVMVALGFNSIIAFRRSVLRQPVLALSSLAMIVLSAIGLITAAGLHQDLSKGVPANAINWCVWCFLALGIGTVTIAAWILRETRHTTAKNGATGKKVGTTVALATGLYMVFAVADHLVFFYSDREAAGVANLSLVKAPDVQCEGMVPIRKEGEVLRYRCPTNVVLGGTFNTTPFVPWPAYQEGTSKALKDTLDAMLADAKHGLEDE